MLWLVDWVSYRHFMRGEGVCQTRSRWSSCPEGYVSDAFWEEAGLGEGDVPLTCKYMYIVVLKLIL